MLKFRPAAFALATILAVAATPAFAQQTTTTTFEVSITIENDCTIDIDDLDFGTAGSLASSVTGTTTVSVTCVSEIPFEIAFDVGTGGGSLTTRLLALDADTVAYNLYRDDQHTEVLGDGTSGTVTIAQESTGGEPDLITIYGMTEPDQGPKPPGTYTSTITAILAF